MTDQVKSKKDLVVRPDRQSAKVLFGRLLRDYVSRYKGRVALAVFFMIVGAATTAATAFLMKPIVDKVFLEKDASMVLWTTLAVLIVFTVRGFATYWQTILMNWVGSRIVADIQSDLFKKIINADLAWFHANPTGQLISKFIFDTTLLRTGTTQTLIVLTKDSLTAIFLIGSLFYYDWKMALLIVVVLPPCAVAIKQLGRRSRKAITNNLEQTGYFSGFLEEVFQGIRVVKAYGQENQAQEYGDKVINRRFKFDLKAMQVQATANPIVESVSGAIIAGVIYYGASSVTAGETTPGTFFSFITAVMLAYQPIKSVAKITPQMQNGLAAAERVFQLMDIVHEVVEKPDAKSLALTEGQVRFENVTFSYGSEAPILKDLSLQIEAGTRVALVGPSGGGKSTILNLIPRFYDVNNGQILIDNQDTRGVTFNSLRDKIALVSQDIFLFDDTVRANIAYGQQDVSDEAIIAAAKSAAAHGFITALPEGYETSVGSNGVRLSGGQKQRIAIARAMLKDSPILLLDEATSALDTDSERKIQSALTNLMKGRTSLVIAHRLSTILDADRIYVIVEGQVAESGTHNELLEVNGVYADLYNKQFESDTSLISTSGAN